MEDLAASKREVLRSAECSTPSTRAELQAKGDLAAPKLEAIRSWRGSSAWAREELQGRGGCATSSSRDGSSSDS